ncbi:nucleoside/nucleotide kinase family protein, partial [Staphylococcus epidermidis]
MHPLHYFFKTKQQFHPLIKHHHFIHYPQYVRNYYPTPLQYLNHTIQEPHHLFLQIQLQPPNQLTNKFPHPFFIFLPPPTLHHFKQPLLRRGTESDQNIQTPVNNPPKELQ